MKRSHEIFLQIQDQFPKMEFAYINLTELDSDPELALAEFMRQLDLLRIYLEQLSREVNPREEKRIL